MGSITRRQALKFAAAAGATLATGGSATEGLSAAPQANGSRSLREAVRAFNARAAQNPIGKRQPPLSEDEVIAAIRWSAHDWAQLPVSDEEYRAFREIAETRRLPADAELEVLTDFEPNDEFVFEAWSVRLRMPRKSEGMEGSTYGYPVRERWIRSRRIGAEERKVIEKWQTRWKEQGGIASFDRAQYADERAKAVETDQKNQRSK